MQLFICRENATRKPLGALFVSQYEINGEEVGSWVPSPYL